MDSLSSEVGHKMRSAVKAKLIELGSGTSAGYIDDELPDYVMIMVANKRSKIQMIDDLKLFLGKNTDVFVNWLHQVLEKLQEVTLPASAVQKSKRKISETIDKKDKKISKKKSKQDHKSKSSADETTERSTTPPLQTTPVATASITDVFANHFMQRAKKSLERVDSLNIKTKKEFAAQNSKAPETTDGFDIPTISEIAKNAAGEANRRKELTELQELQKKINQAKKQLKELAADESEDEDFINLKADGDDLGAEYENAGAQKGAHMNKNNKNPNTSDQSEVFRKSHRVQITYEENSTQSSDQRNKAIRDSTPPPPVAAVETSPNAAGNKKRIPISERLGMKPTNENVISLSAHRRVEQAIYVPAFRRAEAKKKEEPLRSRERSRERESRASRDTARDTRDLRERVRERNRSRPDRSRELSRDKESDYGNKQEQQNTKISVTQRIGSRIIVAPPKPEYNEDAIEVPISSVVKVKPRPVIPKSKQASKNLLLRAVAEAQKSTALPPVRVSKSPEQAKGLYTKSFLNKRVGNNKKIIKDNIVVQVATIKKSGSTSKETFYNVTDNNEEQSLSDEEYVPTSEHHETEDCYVYVPQSVQSSSQTSDDALNDCSPHKVDTSKRTQFVVTMDAKDYRSKKRSLVAVQSNGEKKKSDTIEDSRTILKKRLRLDTKAKTERISSPLRIDIGQKVNKLIIKNDTEDEEELRKEVENSKRSSGRNRSPISFDDKETTRKRSQSRDRKDSPAEKKSKKYSDSNDVSEDRRKEPNNDKKDSQSESQKVKISRSTSDKKYDNLPPLSSAITMGESKTPKKERCKFYPSCGKGERCEYVHPSSPCKSFPNCKFGDMCLYIHPKCKFDLTCSRLNCSYTHTPVISAAPPLASHVVPVSNYKKLVTTALPALCKFYPNCSNTICEFYHPKPCKFGKGCTNKVECNFYHFEIPTVPSKNKLKWVASAV